MRLLLNILWLLFGGLFSALGWVLTGCLWCITVIGIPVGLQCFKLASISLDPFGKEIVYDDENAVSFLLNILWIIFGAAIFAAIWMMRGHQWGRGLIVFLEIIILGLSWFMFSAGVWWAGLLTAASALAALVFLFHRRSLEWAEATHGF